MTAADVDHTFFAQDMVGPYLPDVSRALSLDAALSGPPARLPSPAAPLSINPNPFAEPPVHQPEDGHAQQLAALLEAAEGAPEEDRDAAADSPASPTAAPAGAAAEPPASAAPAGEGQHRRQLEEGEEEPAGHELEGAAGDEEDRIEAGYDRLGSVPSLSVAPSGARASAPLPNSLIIQLAACTACKLSNTYGVSGCYPTLPARSPPCKPQAPPKA